MEKRREGYRVRGLQMQRNGRCKKHSVPELELGWSRVGKLNQIFKGLIC